MGIANQTPTDATKGTQGNLRLYVPKGCQMAKGDGQMETSCLTIMKPEDAAKWLIHDIGNGEITQSGDRTSSYLEIAVGLGKCEKSSIYVCIVEEKNGLPSVTWGYGIHLIDDINNLDCQYFQTDSLREEDLAAELKKLFGYIEAGRFPEWVIMREQ